MQRPRLQKNSDDLTNNIILEKNTIKSVKGKIYITTGKTLSSSSLINSYLEIKNKETQKVINYLRKNLSFLNIQNQFEKFSKLKVLVVGETIIDQYNFCRAIGKSEKNL